LIRKLDPSSRCLFTLLDMPPSLSKSSVKPFPSGSVRTRSELPRRFNDLVGFTLEIFLPRPSTDGRVIFELNSGLSRHSSIQQEIAVQFHNMPIMTSTKPGISLTYPGVQRFFLSLLNLLFCLGYLETFFLRLGYRLGLFREADPRCCPLEDRLWKASSEAFPV